MSHHEKGINNYSHTITTSAWKICTFAKKGIRGMSWR